MERLIETGKYGTLYATGFKWIDGRISLRAETYVPHDTHERIYETTMIAGDGDFSPRWDGDTHYHPDCACCWLHFTHSTAKHLARLSRSKWRRVERDAAERLHISDEVQDA